MKRLVILLLALSLIVCVSAIEFEARTGVANQLYNYTFNFTTNADCSGVLLSYSDDILTDSNGNYFFSIPTNSLTAIPYYLCEYKDSALRKTHNFSDIIFRSIRVQNITSEKIFTENINSSDWTNVTITESQISDLDHFDTTDETDPEAYNGTLAYNSSLADYLGINSTSNNTNYLEDYNVSMLHTYFTGLNDLVYYSILNPFSFYNSTDFSIGDYYLNSNPYSFWNSTFATFNKTYADTLYYGNSDNVNFTNINATTGYFDTLTVGNANGTFNGAWNGSSNYYLNTNPFTFWNSTFATFNKTYADTLYGTIGEPLWTSNFTAYNSSWSSIYNATYDAKADYQYGANEINGSGNITTENTLKGKGFEIVSSGTTGIKTTENTIFGAIQVAELQGTGILPWFSIKDTLYIRGTAGYSQIFLTGTGGLLNVLLRYNETEDTLKFAGAVGGYHFDEDIITTKNINASNFNGAWNGSSNYALVGEPLWTTNLTAHNSSWSSTYNSTYDAKYENKDSVNFTSLNISDVTISDYIQDILSDEAIVGCGLSFQQGDLKWSNNSVETDCWKVANGSVGTTDLRQQQLLSASALYSQGDSGGSYQGLGTHSHGNTLYGMGVQNNGAGQFNAGGMYAAGTIVQVTGNSHSASSPPYYTEILKQCMCEGLI